MITIMRNAGDSGRTEREDLLERVLEVIENEYPILVLGFQQRSEGLHTIQRFQEDVERFLNAFITTLYCCRTRAYWLQVLHGLEHGLQSLLSPYFIVEITHWESVHSRGAKLKLSVKPKFAQGLDQAKVNKISSVHTGYPGTSSAEPAVNWKLYRKVTVAEIRFREEAN
jgi:hypothetical protein